MESRTVVSIDDLSDGATDRRYWHAPSVPFHRNALGVLFYRNAPDATAHQHALGRTLSMSGWTERGRPLA